jgi:hypothetical protein
MKSSCSNRRFFAARVAFAFLLLTGTLSPAVAQTFTTVTPLSFGTIAIRDYNAVGRVTILSGGAFTYNSNVYLHDNPTRGEYLLQGYAPNTIYTVTLPASFSVTGPGGNMTVDDLSTEPALLITNASGDDTFYIIGRLQTLGGGNVYYDGNYDTVFAITLNF